MQQGDGFVGCDVSNSCFQRLVLGITDFCSVRASLDAVSTIAVVLGDEAISAILFLNGLREAAARDGDFGLFIISDRQFAIDRAAIDCKRVLVLCAAVSGHLDLTVDFAATRNSDGNIGIVSEAAIHVKRNAIRNSVDDGVFNHNITAVVGHGIRRSANRRYGHIVKRQVAIVLQNDRRIILCPCGGRTACCTIQVIGNRTIFQCDLIAFQQLEAKSLRLTGADQRTADRIGAVIKFDRQTAAVEFVGGKHDAIAGTALRQRDGVAVIGSNNGSSEGGVTLAVNRSDRVNRNGDAGGIFFDIGAFDAFGGIDGIGNIIARICDVNLCSTGFIIKEIARTSNCIVANTNLATSSQRAVQRKRIAAIHCNLITGNLSLGNTTGKLNRRIASRNSADVVAVNFGFQICATANIQTACVYVADYCVVGKFQFSTRLTKNNVLILFVAILSVRITHEGATSNLELTIAVRCTNHTSNRAVFKSQIATISGLCVCATGNLDTGKSG